MPNKLIEKPKALIFGVTGQDGAYLSSILLSKGYDVAGVSRNPEKSSTNLSKLGIQERVHIRRLDVTQTEEVLHLIRELQPNEIYNLSGQSAPGASFDMAHETISSNVLGTLNILEAMRRVQPRARLLNAASSECFADNGDIPIDEQTPCLPRNPYGVAKTAASHLVRTYREAHGLHASSAYLFNHESPLRSPRFVTQKIVAAACSIAEGKQTTLRLGNVEVQRDWGWAPDYVEAMWRMLQRRSPDDFVLATGRTSKLRDFVDLAFREVGLDWRHHVQIDQTLFRRNELLCIYANPGKAERLLKWRAEHLLADIVREMICAHRAGQVPR